MTTTSFDPSPPYIKTDGGRSAAGFKGTTGDCAVRAIAVVTSRPYSDVYALVGEFCKREKPSKRRRRKSSPRTGVYRVTMDAIMRHLGYTWTATMGVGTGCKVHVSASELPPGRLVLRLSRHYAAFIDGHLHDNHDSSRAGTRCVYGYWSRP